MAENVIYIKQFSDFCKLNDWSRDFSFTFIIESVHAIRWHLESLLPIDSAEEKKLTSPSFKTKSFVCVMF